MRVVGIVLSGYGNDGTEDLRVMPGAALTYWYELLVRAGAALKLCHTTGWRLFAHSDRHMRRFVSPRASIRPGTIVG